MSTRTQIHSLWEHSFNINKGDKVEKERTLNEMYLLLLSQIPKNSVQGLCTLMYHLLCEGRITRSEYERLCKHFDSEKPRKMWFGLRTINKRFLKHHLYTGTTFWWKYESDISAQQEQRRLFIEHLINKTK